MPSIRLFIWNDEGLKDMIEDGSMVSQFGEIAEGLAGKVGDVPAHLELVVRRGVGPRSTFAQVILRGPGALAWEFGTRTQAPHGTLRRAIGGG